VQSIITRYVGCKEKHGYNAGSKNAKRTDGNMCEGTGLKDISFMVVKMRMDGCNYAKTMTMTVTLRIGKRHGCRVTEGAVKVG
jgi:hypothetical protein